MQPGRANNREDFIYLIDQALDEVEDLRAAIEYDEEYMGASSLIVEPLSDGLSSLLATVKKNEYTTGQDGLLDFLHILNKVDHRAVPFWPLLKRILDTHEQGYVMDSQQGQGTPE